MFESGAYYIITIFIGLLIYMSFMIWGGHKREVFPAFIFIPFSPFIIPVALVIMSVLIFMCILFDLLPNLLFPEEPDE